MEEEIAFVKLQPRKSGSIMATIPAVIIHKFNIKGNERAKVILDIEKKRIIYQL